MARRQCVLLLVVLFVLLITLEATLVRADGKGSGNGDGGGNGSGESGKDKGKAAGDGGSGYAKGGGDKKDIGNGKDNENGKVEGNDKVGGEKGNGKGGDEKEEGNDSGKGKGGEEKGNDNGKGKGGEDKGKGSDNSKGKSGGDEGKGNDNDNGKGKGNDDKGKGKGDDGKGKGNGNDKGKGNGEAPTTHYQMVSPVKTTGQERALCLSEGRCYNKTLTCPKECAVRKPKQSKKHKGCFTDCSKCETTCKYRRANCEGYGSVCYDPRFVGGDGVMFYFHGAKGENFALVSDEQLHINGHFIGNRPNGRKRDFTWVQALAVMFDTHTLVIAAQRVTKWDDSVDALLVRWEGEDVLIPTDEEAEWQVISDAGREVLVERTADTNSIRLTIDGLVEIDVKVTPIGAEENRVHNYQLPADDAFAHLETQFLFKSLTDGVEGVLGKTYQPDYVSPVKVGVPMPLMGGEDRYKTPSFLSHVCASCRFQRPVPATQVTVNSQTGISQY
ncbi:uncharacterized protein [Aristolochia californica]|uniref:uncharacterized protein n=1 Tax=Aristolochia californica TaxID=171875 RepID=UPI0035D7742B